MSFGPSSPVWHQLVLVLLALAITELHARPLKPIAARASVPATDPFYQPPAGYEAEEPGTILRTRSIVASFFGLLLDAVEAHQLLYRTTAVNGTAIATVTTGFKPLLGAATDRFVSFQTAYDSSDTVCDPSYNYELGAVQTDIISAVEFLILQVYLAEGYIVAAPDYEGPDAAFAPGRLEGMGVLDGMRAVSAYTGLGFSTTTPAIVGVGYSGGAIASGWAASLQSDYAPELSIKGWAAGGTPANLTGTTVFVDNTVFSGFLPAALDGLAKPSAYGAELGPFIESIITPLGQSKLTFANTYCAVEDILNFAEQSVLSTSFQSLGYDLVYDPTFVSVMQQNIMGLYANETPIAPVLLYHAALDEIIPYANASTLFDSWCSNGASVQFTTYGSGGHATTELLGVPAAVEFVEAAFAGTVASGCSSNTVLDSTVDPLALGLDLEPLLTGLLDALVRFGEQDANLISDLAILETLITVT
ncbi:hypothetical protein LTR85_008636 [Meristemomyces frigidus]|nr:hypothetical protein LTR85_008636 [Meristemomyces frigidus]